eukprot:GHRQ01000514.1.p3 GENE.GHRQ01000514.1~~GHRQ01000514.1.p3  ORF type:complete len:104 (-),score=11.53 GHRQ01000514.1:867-1178(-)
MQSLQPGHLHHLKDAHWKHNLLETISCSLCWGPHAVMLRSITHPWNSSSTPLPQLIARRSFPCKTALHAALQTGFTQRQLCLDLKNDQPAQLTPHTLQRPAPQ